MSRPRPCRTQCALGDGCFHTGKGVSQARTATLQAKINLYMGGANETRWRSPSSTSRLLKRSDSGQVACGCRCPPPSPPPSFGAAVRRWVVVPFPKSQFGGKDPIASRSGRTRVSRRVLSAIWPVRFFARVHPCVQGPSESSPVPVPQ